MCNIVIHSIEMYLKYNGFDREINFEVIPFIHRVERKRKVIISSNFAEIYNNIESKMCFKLAVSCNPMH